MITVTYNEDTLDEHDIFLNDSVEDANTSFLCVSDNSPLSFNIDFTNGSPLVKDYAHYNCNTCNMCFGPIPLKQKHLTAVFILPQLT